MSRRRVARLNEQIRRELSEIVRDRVRDPRVANATVAAVEVSGDLSHARVFVRSIAGLEGSGDAADVLDHASSFIRRELGQRLALRRVPELHFQPDRSQEGSIRIERLLDEVRPEGGWDEEAVEDADDPEDDAGESE